MLSISDTRNALQALRDIVNLDLFPLFDSLSPQFVPSHPVSSVDWLTYIKSSSFDPLSFTSDSQSFIDYVANANNFLALKADPFAYNIVKSTASARDIFYSSFCSPLLPQREVALSVFNGESMTGYVYIASYRPYKNASVDTSVFWELRFRSSNLSLCHVVDNFRYAFNPVGKLILKSTLGNYYSASGSYLYDADCILRVVDV